MLVLRARILLDHADRLCPGPRGPRPPNPSPYSDSACSKTFKFGITWRLAVHESFWTMRTGSVLVRAVHAHQIRVHIRIQRARKPLSSKSHVDSPCTNPFGPCGPALSWSARSTPTKSESIFGFSVLENL